MDTQVHRSAALLHKSRLLFCRSAHVTGLKMAETELTVWWVVFWCILLRTLVSLLCSSGRQLAAGQGAQQDTKGEVRLPVPQAQVNLSLTVIMLK